MTPTSHKLLQNFTMEKK